MAINNKQNKQVKIIKILHLKSSLNQVNYASLRARHLKI